MTFRFRMLGYGFTLIELLVVISIISLLSSIVLNNLNSAREKAKTSALITEMNELNKAIIQYAHANDGAPIDARYYTETRTTGPLFTALVPNFIADILDNFYTRDGNGNATGGDLYYCSSIGTSGGYNCNSDEDPFTYSLRVYLPITTNLGPPGYYCWGSSGIRPSIGDGSEDVTGGSVLSCSQF